jgi:uridine kinase
MTGAVPEAAAQYQTLAESAGQESGTSTLISDRLELRDEVLGLGMGMIYAPNLDAAHQSLGVMLDPGAHSDERFYANPLYSSLSYEDVINTLCPAGKINVVGFIGRTGAGKSTTINRLLDMLGEMDGRRGGKFELDSFFAKTRKERKAWLSEPCISDEERASRGNVSTWWDFDLALQTLDRIRAGEHVHLEGLYDMEQDGEKVGVMDIDPGSGGYTVFVEGTTLLMPVMCEAIDSFIYLNTHDQTRAQALFERNLRHGYTEQESRDRKKLTDAAETQDHISRELRVARFTKGRLSVLDNTDRGDHVKLLPPYIPQI